MPGPHSFAAGAPVDRPAPAALDLESPTAHLTVADVRGADRLDLGLEPAESAAVPGSAGTVVLARFRVFGIPKPQGSKVPFIDRSSGQARIKEQSEASHRSWRNDVAAAALKARDELGLDGPLDGALALEVTFRFPMAQSRTKAERRAGMILKTTAPDTSKLVRSVEDSMEAAGLIRNDARFAVELASKVEVLDGWTGAEIVIRRAA